MGNDNLAAFLGGSGAGEYADLNQFEKTLGQNNTLRQIAAPVLGAKFDTSTWSPGQVAATTLGQAFLGTILSKLGENQVADQLGSAASVLPQLYADPASVNAPAGVDPEAFGQLKLSAMKNVTSRDMARDEITNKNRESLFAEVFSKNPSVAVLTMPEMASKYGIQIPQKTEVPAPEIAPIDIGPNLSSGQDSTVKKMQKYFQEFAAQGMPATQAATAARQQVEGEIKANAKTYDEAKAAREYGQNLLNLSSTAKAGMSQAGQTGHLQGIRHLYDYLASTVSEDASKKLEGDSILSSIAPEIVKMNRSPGAVSDYETRLYLGSGPSVNNTPETNKILAQKMEDLGKLNLDYADFLEAYRQANAGSTAGAGKKWSEYRQAFPIFNGDSTKIELNSDRPSWQEYFSGQAQPQVSQVPTVGSDFMGYGKVKSIKKLK